MGFYFNLFTDSSDLRHISEGISIKGPSQDNSDYAATDKTLNLCAIIVDRVISFD